MFFSLPFFLFILTFFTAVMTTHVSNPIYAILYLIFTFLNTALLVFTLKLDFFALIYIIIYVGALSILFLFIIMTLNLKKLTLFINIKYHAFFSTMLGFLLLFPLLVSLWIDLPYVYIFSSSNQTHLNWFDVSQQTSILSVIGSVLYTNYSFCFIVAGLILFVGMVGAIFLTLNENIVHPRHQDIFFQLQRIPNNSVFMVNIKK